MLPNDFWSPENARTHPKTSRTSRVCQNNALVGPKVNFSQWKNFHIFNQNFQGKIVQKILEFS